MMGKISAILASIIFATAPLASGEGLVPRVEESQRMERLGKDTVSSVRKAYELGEYDEFLKSMDEAYKDADLSGLIQMRERDVPLEDQELLEAKFLALQMKKNGDLLKIISDFDDSVFADKVRSLAASSSTSAQEKAISRLNSHIAKAPNTGANQDENRLIDIDLEFEYKLFHAKFPLDNVSPQERNDHQLVLRMAKMDKMKEAAKNFQDHELKKAVDLAEANLDQRLARNLDGADLNALVKAKVKPANETQERVFSVISSYQGQFDDLMKEF
jgi:hypothetical protein